MSIVDIPIPDLTWQSKEGTIVPGFGELPIFAIASAMSKPVVCCLQVREERFGYQVCRLTTVMVRKSEIAVARV